MSIASKTLQGVAPAAPRSAPGPASRSVSQESLSPGAYRLRDGAVPARIEFVPMATDGELKTRALARRRLELECSLLGAISRAYVRMNQLVLDGNGPKALEARSQIVHLERALARLEKSGIQ